MVKVTTIYPTAQSKSLGTFLDASVKGNIDWNHPLWPSTTVAICMSYFTTGDPGKEHRTNKPSPTWRVRESSKGGTTCPTTSQNPCWHPSWLSNECATRKDSESEWLAKDNLETNPITIKPEAASHVTAVLPGSLNLLLSTRAPLPDEISLLYQSAHVSLWTI